MAGKGRYQHWEGQHNRYSSRPSQGLEGSLSYIEPPAAAPITQLPLALLPEPPIRYWQRREKSSIEKDTLGKFGFDEDVQERGCRWITTNIESKSNAAVVACGEILCLSRSSAPGAPVYVVALHKHRVYVLLLCECFSVVSGVRLSAFIELPFRRHLL